MTSSIRPFTHEDLRQYVMESGWRLFAELWETENPAALRQHALLFPNLMPGDGVPEYPNAVLTFVIDSQIFAVVPSQGEYLFFVKDPECDSKLLLAVAGHFNALLHRVTDIGFTILRQQP